MPADRQCPQCKARLPHDSPGGLCVMCVLREALAAPDDYSWTPLDARTPRLHSGHELEPASEHPGDRMGRYKLLQEINRGGIGSFWMAEKEDASRRRVALKVVQMSLDSKKVLARFEAKRPALALMNHPNIAKALDAGSTVDTAADGPDSQISNLKSEIPQGRPFFVMELVRGLPITHYCNRHALSIRERLAMFAQVCQAIHHAHEIGIVHRDIKSSNILVTYHHGAPIPKVIGFGIASAIMEQPLTDPGHFATLLQLLGSPAYVCPEQAQKLEGDTDARGDIHNLGVLLYELLVGKTPFETKWLLQTGPDEMCRILAEEEPPRPSIRFGAMDAKERAAVAKRCRSKPLPLIGTLRGDLDWITMTCLEKDPARRYASAALLAADLQRHCDHELVTVSPPSKLYRLRKLVLRNKLARSLGAASVDALASGLVSWATRSARNRPQRATPKQHPGLVKP